MEFVQVSTNSTNEDEIKALFESLDEEWPRGMAIGSYDAETGIFTPEPAESWIAARIMKVDAEEFEYERMHVFVDFTSTDAISVGEIVLP